MRVFRHRKEWGLAITAAPRYLAITVWDRTIRWGDSDPDIVWGPGVSVMRWFDEWTVSVFVSTRWWWDIATWRTESDDRYAEWKVDAWSGAVYPPDEDE